MTQRERLLAGIVGLLVLTVGAWYFIGQYRGALQVRQRQIDTLAKKLSDENFTKKKAEMALQRLNRYQQHALPESTRASQAFYQERLRGTIEAAGFRNIVIKPLSGRESGNHYQHMFSLSGRATLGQLVQFCYEFYSFNVLHKFSKLSLVPIRGSEELDVSMTVVVLSVDGATEVPQDEEVRLGRLTHGGVKDYLNLIAERNLFAPANKAPLFTSKTIVEAELERPLSYRISASDPDKDDRVSFYLGENPPPGVEISESGSLRWTPSALGEYKIVVEARDNRSPPKSSIQELTINVVEPEPEPEPSSPRPSFDEAKYTFLTGTVAVGADPKAWLNNRPKNVRLQLGPGDTFTIGTLKGKVVDVRDREVILEIEGQRKVLSIGQPLADATTMDTAESL